MSASERMAMLIDVSKCMGCRGCQVACKQWNQRPAEKTKFTGTYQNPPRLSGQTWTLVSFTELAGKTEKDPPRWLFRKQQCLHCGEATCLQVCPTGAIRRTDEGIVYINQDICAGCKYCVETCPFGTPHPDPDTGTARKCWMCKDRVENGLKPACVTACPTGALEFGPRDAMVKLAKARIKVLEGQGYTPRLYGETELGGLGAMYVLPEKASVYGLPEDPKLPHAGIAYRWALGVIPGLALLAGIWHYLRKSPPAEEAATADQRGGE
ncbi:MAG: 4Fe-4S dicluster domain-containing protein [Planctomycetota bacterium]